MKIERYKDRDYMNDQLNTAKKMMWLHDSYWHATAVKKLGPELANELNLEANEKYFRKHTLLLLKSGEIKRPESIEDLVEIFKKVWADCFFDGLYVDEPISIQGNTAIWTGKACSAYDSLKAADMVDSYECGCKSIRNGVMKALRLKTVHSIEKSLINGDGECVISFTFAPK